MLDDLNRELFELEQKKAFLDSEESILNAQIQELQQKMDALKANLSQTRLQRPIINGKISDKRREIQRYKEEEERHNSDEIFYKELTQDIAEIVKDFEPFKRARHYQYDDIIATLAAYRKDKGGMLNANDMGAGKTAETVMSLFIIDTLFQEEHGRRPNILWLTKKSLVEADSPMEIMRWWPGVEITPVKGAKNKMEREFLLEIYDIRGGIFMANYEFVRTTPVAQTYPWDILVVDEAHKLKGGANPSGPTAIFTAVKDLARKTKFNFMLTGTPMVNKPEEMWSYLHVFAPERFPSLKQFMRDYTQYKEVAGSGLVELSVDPNKILNNALKGQMIRRSQSEFGIELPPLTWQKVHLQMEGEQLRVYEQMRKEFFVWLDNQETLNTTAIIAQLTRLRQISVMPSSIVIENKVVDLEGNELINDELGKPVTVKHAVDCKEANKIDEAMDRIEMICSIPNTTDPTGQTTEQVLVFSTFNEPMFEIKRRCEKLNITCEVISGASSKSTAGRNLAVEFQNAKIQVLCINSAMGEGLNLQKFPEQWIGGASYGIFLDKWWNPGRQDQCTKRIVRPGSTIPVTIYELFNDHSIDEYIEALNQEKAEKFASIMDSDIIRPASEWKKYLEDLL